MLQFTVQQTNPLTPHPFSLIITSQDAVPQAALQYLGANVFSKEEYSSRDAYSRDACPRDEC